MPIGRRVSCFPEICDKNEVNVGGRTWHFLDMNVRNVANIISSVSNGSLIILLNQSVKSVRHGRLFMVLFSFYFCGKRIVARCFHWYMVNLDQDLIPMVVMRMMR